MRGVLLVLFLLPSPAAAVLLEYELAVFAENLCTPPVDHFACQRGVSTLLDDTGEPFADLLGELALEMGDGAPAIVQFSIFARPTGFFLVPLQFTADLVEDARVSGGVLDVATTFRGEASGARLIFDPVELLADLDRIQFVAQMEPPLISEARCVITAASPQSLPGRTPAGLSCEKARQDPNLRVIDIPERELVELHIVAIPVPQPAAVLLLGLGALGVACARVRRSEEEGR